jgi:hypothetical protein
MPSIVRKMEVHTIPESKLRLGLCLIDLSYAALLGQSWP